jgi:hypothetical protein
MHGSIGIFVTHYDLNRFIAAQPAACGDLCNETGRKCNPGRFLTAMLDYWPPPCYGTRRSI